MLNSDIVQSSLKFVETYFNDHVNENRAYHNYEHSYQVAEAVLQLSSKAGLSSTEIENLVLAAIFHDIGYCIDPVNHEEVGARIAINHLQAQGINTSRQGRIKSYILATNLYWKGEDPNALYLRDADLAGLSASDHYKNSELLRKEITSINGTEKSESQWLDDNILFFKNHSYHTKEGKQKYNKGKKKNLKKLLSIKKDEFKPEEIQTMASSKAAQTQLKTSLRNHIDLSSIADNKANIMLSINAIVITVGIPLMAEQFAYNSYFLFPMIALGLSSTISMAYATLSTRPLKMKGITNLSSIPDKKTNLFFFGNYYRMDFKTYELGIKEVIADNELLENSITRDLFFLGKSLGKKFGYLRICYNIFLIGMIVTAILFIVVFAVVNMGAAPLG